MQQDVRDDLKIYMKDTLENIISEMPVDTKLLMFPMNHGRAAGEKGGYHWTLLVLNLPISRWLHYNTLLPRSGRQKKKQVDHYYDEAQQMVCLKVFITLSLFLQK